MCIRHWDWSETSQTVSLFTREHGVVRAVAKGAKRERAPFSGGLELLTAGEMMAIVRQNERSPDALATLTSWDLLDTFPGTRRNLAAFYAGLYFADLVHHAVRDADPHPVLFDRLIQCLRAIEDPSRVNVALMCFQWATLVQTGFVPELYRDAATGTEIETGGPIGFSPSLGGFTSVGRATGEMVWRVRAETVEAIRAVAAAEGSSDPVSAVIERGLDSEVVLRANRLLAWYFRFVLGTWPNSASAAIPGVAEVEPQR